MPDELHEATQGEKRTLVRQTCRLPIALTTIDITDRTIWPAEAMNLSSGGVGFLSSRRFQPGTLLCLKIQSPADDSETMLLARVVRALAQANGWLHGCVLSSRLAEDEFQAVLDAPQQAACKSPSPSQAAEALQTRAPRPPAALLDPQQHVRLRQRMQAARLQRSLSNGTTTGAVATAH